MSVLNQSGEEQVECPLCMEPLEVDDLHFYPCTCGYQICRFCWNRIREGENGLCPACRKAYPENPADFTPLSQEQVAAIKTEKKAREQKRRNKTLESRRALANVRVVQNNLVFVVGLPVRLADPEILKRQEYFGKYGKIHKVVINQSTTYAGSQGPSASAYVTYVSPADALRAIQGVNNVALDGRVLKGSLGTTKYCANFMKNQPCPKPDCMYLHELGDPKASFTKEEMHAGLHQVYERKLHNQLLQAQRDKPEEKHAASGNSSTNAEKNSSKEGNPSNFIPTTVVTSSHINVVSSSKSKKDSVNISNGSNGIEASNSNGLSVNGNGNGKEAWPSLGSSPPSDSPARKQSSPKPQQSQVKSQENGTSESSSPTQQMQQQQQQQPAQTRSKEHTDTRIRHKDNTQTKKNKTDSKKRNSIHVNHDTEDHKPASITQSSVFENDTQYLSNELDELESDRHSLLENHDLLDNSDHSLLEDDTHNLLDDVNNQIIMLQIPPKNNMLSGLLDNDHLLPQMKSPMMNGYGLPDRDTMSYIGNDRHSQISQGMMEKELLVRERSRSEMLMRNELMARHDPSKPYMSQGNVPLVSNTELLGANYHSRPALLPFGLRVEHAAPLPSMAAVQYSVHSQIANGFDQPHSSLQNEGRYLAENMDKFFTDFHKAQQMRLLLARAPEHAHAPRHYPLDEHKQRMGPPGSMGMAGAGAGAGAEAAARAAGDADDDLDFDPFKETQKALAEMMETEMMQNTSGDNMERVRRARLPPPGFAHAAFPPPAHQMHHHQHHQGYSNNTASYSDWTQMDPAIMSTSVNFGKPVPGAGAGAGAGGLSAQQQELWARFNQLGQQPPNGAKLPLPWGTKLGWGSPHLPLNNIPLPPGFSPAKPPQHPAECIDAK